ncbi:MAG TPA: hypothetical protein V6D17_00395 [Candidatus Obscuribacterales bacterium]
MRKFSLIAVTALALGLSCTASFADEDRADGKTVIDGTDVRQFFGSGPEIDTEAMEDASVHADKAIHLDPEYPGEKQILPVPDSQKMPATSVTTSASPGAASRASAPSASSNSANQTAQTQSQNSSSSNNSNNKSKLAYKGKNDPNKRQGPIKWYLGAWKRFFTSTGNLLGLPVGSDDDGTGDLKPPPGVYDR